MHAGKYLPGLMAAFAVLPAHAQQTTPAPTPAPTRPPITTIPAIIPERFSIGPPTQTPTPQPTPTPTPVVTPTPRATTAAPPQRVPVPQAIQPQALPSPVATPKIAVTPVPQAVPVQPQVIASPTPAPIGEGSAPAETPPWLWALLGAGLTAVAGLAALLVLRRRRPVAEPLVPVAEAAPAAPLPPVRGPSPARVVPPAPVAAEPFEIAIQPQRIEIGAQEIAIEIELLIANSSGAAADGVRLSVAAIAANPQQDAQLAAFLAQSQFAPVSDPFDLAAGAGGRLPVHLMLPRNTLHVVELGGHPMFVPIVVVDVRYRSGLSIRRHSAAFMLGGAGQSGKPAPIWLDRGQPRGPFAASRYIPSR